MAESIITDSSEYSEDFEDFESSSETVQGFSESDVFPQLFNYLEKNLSEDSYINYRPQAIPSQLAVGLFLSQAKLSKFDFLSKLNWEYSQKKQNLRNLIKFELNFSKFPKSIKSVLCQMRSETDYLNLVTKRSQTQALDQVRAQSFHNLGTLIKDKCQADTMLASQRSAIHKKSEELEDLFAWTKFNLLLKTLVPTKIHLSTPSDKHRSETKPIIENYFKQNLTIKNAIALEDSDFSSALGTRKALTTGPDRKLEISEVCQDLSKAEDLLTNFLTFSKRPAKPKNLNLTAGSCLLNRAFINAQRGTSEDSLSQFLFIAENPQKLINVKNFDFCSAEENVFGVLENVEIDEFHLKNRNLCVKIGRKEVRLRTATVNDLSALPCSPLEGGVKREGVALYTLCQEHFYSCRSVKKQFLRSLKKSELEELFDVYLYRNKEKRVQIESFPDSRRPVFKHKYLVIKDSLLLNSGVFSKHWLLQLKESEVKKNPSDFSLPRMCKWDLCMSPLVGETHLTRMATEFSLLTSKVKLISKKGLNPLKKSRTASEAIVVPDLCVFHNNLRSVMRNDGLITKQLIYDNSIELWKATQSGINWQEQLSENNKLSKLCSGSAKSIMTSYFLNVFHHLSSKPAMEELSESVFSSQKMQILNEIENLKRIKEAEAICTLNLKKILAAGTNSSYLKVRIKQYAVVTIQEVLQMQTSSKCLKIRSLKDQIESFIALKQNQSDLSPYQHFRVNTAKQMDVNSTYNDSIRKIKEEAYKKVLSPYYEPRLRVIKRLQKSRVPKSACADRVDLNKN